MSKKFYLKSVLFCAETTNPLAVIESARMDIEEQVKKLTNDMTITRGGQITRASSGSSIGNTDNTNLNVKSEKFGFDLREI